MNLDNMDQELREMIRKLSPEQIAKDMRAVQPMDDAAEAFGVIYEYLKGKEVEMK